MKADNFVMTKYDSDSENRCIDDDMLLVVQRQLYSQANYLFAEFEKTGGLDFINQAVDLDRKLLGLCTFDHPDRNHWIAQLQYHLWTRYNRFGALTDLEEAMELMRILLAILPQGDPFRAIALNNAALYLSSWYHRFGKMADLDEAIVLSRESLELRPRGHPDRRSSLCNVALCLSARYQQLGIVTDLHEAIALEREMLELPTREDTVRSTTLRNLAADLYLLYLRLEQVTEIDEVIVLSREALDLCPQEHTDRPMSLDNLAVYLAARYDRHGGLADLDEAIVLGQAALELCPRGHPERWTRLHNLADRLLSRFQKLEEKSDFDDAFTLNHEALDICLPGHPGRSIILESLACQLTLRFIIGKELKDLEDAFGLCAQLAHVTRIVSLSDIHAAKGWALAAELFHHPTVLPAYQTSLRFLAQYFATLPSLPEHLPVVKELASSLAVDAFSACLRNNSPTNAVELLEQGRGVFYNQLIRLRSPLDDVAACGPGGKTLADEFTRLTSLIRDVAKSPTPHQHDRLCHLNLDLEKVVTNIRELPGLARFLLPSFFCDLQRAASGGPVIIVNASRCGCDALVVFVDRDPIHVPLGITKAQVQELASDLQCSTSEAKHMDITREIGRILRTLWDEVVSPIVNVLSTTVPAQSRIWWCPTAEFSSLPLHAAGPYRRGQLNLSHLYVSSYTPTLTALVRARRHDQKHSTTDEKRIVGIGQAKAAGESELETVDNELSIISQRMEGLASFTRVEGSDACIARVSEELKKHEWVHFACHGLPNRERPFESALALHDGHFTVERIMQCELENSEFAFLSACHTMVGDEDEVIHLTSAMQMAGFRSVIGTMWAVDDGHANRITSAFYEKMVGLDHTQAALALNETMKDMVEVPLDQRILYVHVGI